MESGPIGLSPERARGKRFAKKGSKGSIRCVELMDTIFQFSVRMSSCHEPHLDREPLSDNRMFLGERSTQRSQTLNLEGTIQESLERGRSFRLNPSSMDN